MLVASVQKYELWFRIAVSLYHLGLVKFKVMNHRSEPLPKSLGSLLVGWFSGSKGRFSSSRRNGVPGKSAIATPNFQILTSDFH
ncbi:hypothetical protein [Nostoc sp. JL33]|uniref:hypothetical protein n=1 Tax=Nostoc sp. JL33 TaxID=2815396 RepID=UPI0025F61FE5|nr:hypothetical protein [Nostoc sp. JL33]MBN3869781.1 hypothetical protein [Nostoc sp. JL33]